MTIDEKLELLAKVIRKEIRAEIFIEPVGWRSLIWCGTSKVFLVLNTLKKDGEKQGLSDLMFMSLREKPIVPLLTREEVEFLKYADGHLYLLRNGDGLMVLDTLKPYSGEHGWIRNSMSTTIHIPFHPPFAEITAKNTDCYKILSLVSYAKEAYEHGLV